MDTLNKTKIEPFIEQLVLFTYPKAPFLTVFKNARPCIYKSRLSLCGVLTDLHYEIDVIIDAEAINRNFDVKLKKTEKTFCEIVRAKRECIVCLRCPVVQHECLVDFTETKISSSCVQSDFSSIENSKSPFINTENDTSGVKVRVLEDLTIQETKSMTEMGLDLNNNNYGAELLEQSRDFSSSDKYKKNVNKATRRGESSFRKFLSGSRSTFNSFNIVHPPPAERAIDFCVPSTSSIDADDKDNPPFFDPCVIIVFDRYKVNFQGTFFVEIGDFLLNNDMISIPDYKHISESLQVRRMIYSVFFCRKKYSLLLEKYKKHVIPVNENTRSSNLNPMNSKTISDRACFLIDDPKKPASKYDRISCEKIYPLKSDMDIVNALKSKINHTKTPLDDANCIIELEKVILNCISIDYVREFSEKTRKVFLQNTALYDFFKKYCQCDFDDDVSNNVIASEQRRLKNDVICGISSKLNVEPYVNIEKREILTNTTTKDTFSVLEADKMASNSKNNPETAVMHLRTPRDLFMNTKIVKDERIRRFKGIYNPIVTNLTKIQDAFDYKDNQNSPDLLDFRSKTSKIVIEGRKDKDNVLSLNTLARDQICLPEASTKNNTFTESSIEKGICTLTINKPDQQALEFYPAENLYVLNPFSQKDLNMSLNKFSLCETLQDETDLKPRSKYASCKPFDDISPIKIHDSMILSDSNIIVPSDSLNTDKICNDCSISRTQPFQSVMQLTDAKNLEKFQELPPSSLQNSFHVISSDESVFIRRNSAAFHKKVSSECHASNYSQKHLKAKTESNSNHDNPRENEDIRADSNKVLESSNSLSNMVERTPLSNIKKSKDEISKSSASPEDNFKIKESIDFAHTSFNIESGQKAVNYYDSVIILNNSDFSHKKASRAYDHKSYAGKTEPVSNSDIGLSTVENHKSLLMATRSNFCESFDENKDVYPQPNKTVDSNTLQPRQNKDNNKDFCAQPYKSVGSNTLQTGQNKDNCESLSLVEFDSKHIQESALLDSQFRKVREEIKILDKLIIKSKETLTPSVSSMRMAKGSQAFQSVDNQSFSTNMIHEIQSILDDLEKDTKNSQKGLVNEQNDHEMMQPTNSVNLFDSHNRISQIGIIDNEFTRDNSLYKDSNAITSENLRDNTIGESQYTPIRIKLQADNECFDRGQAVLRITKDNDLVKTANESLTKNVSNSFSRIESEFLRKNHLLLNYNILSPDSDPIISDFDIVFEQRKALQNAKSLTQPVSGSIETINQLPREFVMHDYSSSSSEGDVKRRKQKGGKTLYFQLKNKCRRVNQLAFKKVCAQQIPTSLQRRFSSIDNDLSSQKSATDAQIKAKDTSEYASTHIFPNKRSESNSQASKLQGEKIHVNGGKFFIRFKENATLDKEPTQIYLKKFKKRNIKKLGKISAFIRQTAWKNVEIAIPSRNLESTRNQDSIEKILIESQNKRVLSDSHHHAKSINVQQNIENIILNQYVTSSPAVTEKSRFCASKDANSYRSSSNMEILTKVQNNQSTHDSPLQPILEGDQEFTLISNYNNIQICRENSQDSMLCYERRATFSTNLAIQANPILPQKLAPKSHFDKHASLGQEKLHHAVSLDNNKDVSEDFSNSISDNLGQPAHVASKEMTQLNGSRVSANNVELDPLEQQKTDKMCSKLEKTKRNSDSDPVHALKRRIKKQNRKKRKKIKKPSRKKIKRYFGSIEKIKKTKSKATISGKNYESEIHTHGIEINNSDKKLMRPSYIFIPCHGVGYFGFLVRNFSKSTIFKYVRRSILFKSALLSYEYIKSESNQNIIYEQTHWYLNKKHYVNMKMKFSLHPEKMHKFALTTGFYHLTNSKNMISDAKSNKSEIVSSQCHDISRKNIKKDSDFDENILDDNAKNYKLSHEVQRNTLIEDVLVEDKNIARKKSDFEIQKTFENGLNFSPHNFSTELDFSSLRLESNITSDTFHASEISSAELQILAQKNKIDSLKASIISQKLFKVENIDVEKPLNLLEESSSFSSSGFNNHLLTLDKNRKTHFMTSKPQFNMLRLHDKIQSSYNDNSFGMNQLSLEKHFSINKIREAPEKVLHEGYSFSQSAIESDHKFNVIDNFKIQSCPEFKP